MQKRLSIVLIETDQDRAAPIVAGLRELGAHDIHLITEETELARRVTAIQPDIVLIDLANPSRDILEEMAVAAAPMDRPVAMFVDRSDEQLTRAAIEAGVSAYVVDGLRADRIKPVLDAAIARFNMFQRIRAELAATRAALEERKIIDRAKAILMKARGIDEEAAYALLRKTAMDQGRRVADIAQQLVLAAGLFDMKLDRLRLGYVPLTDAAPMIIAHELGFASEEGLSLELRRISAWAQSRDLLGAGVIDAAHTLAPLPIAQAVGLGPALPAMDLVMFLSQGGEAIAIGTDLAARMRAAGHGFDFADARRAGEVLREVAGPSLRVGVPFRFSTQSELVFHWLDASGFAGAVEVVTVPPPMMAEAMAAGEIDACCVGEPWASFAVEREVGALLLPGTAIWAAPPEKGLVLRRAFTEDRAELTGRLMRALWRAGQWLDEPDNRGTAAEILSRRDYLNLPSELTERGLVGRLMVTPSGEMRDCPDFITFNRGAATFPWKSLAALFAERIIRRHGLDPEPAMRAAMGCYRTDLYRQHLRSAGAPLPGASMRVEGMIDSPRRVAAERGQMILGADAFFDGRVYEPPFTS